MLRHCTRDFTNAPASARPAPENEHAGYEAHLCSIALRLQSAVIYIKDLGTCLRRKSVGRLLLIARLGRHICGHLCLARYVWAKQPLELGLAQVESFLLAIIVVDPMQAGDSIVVCHTPMIEGLVLWPVHCKAPPLGSCAFRPLRAFMHTSLSAAQPCIAQTPDEALAAY